MNEIEILIEELKTSGYSLMSDEEAAIRQISDARMLRSAIAMARDGSPFVLNNIVRQAVEQYRAQTEPPGRAGGEKRMTQDATGQPAAAMKPISLEELQRLIPDATKKATEFEKAPTWEPKVGDAIVVRLKRVHQGGYEQPLVVASEFAGYVNGRLGGTVKWAKKDLKGNILESGEFDTPGVVMKDLRLPTFAVSRAIQQDVKLVEKFVYFLQVVGEKESKFPNPFRQVVVIALGQTFPK